MQLFPCGFSEYLHIVEYATRLVTNHTKISTKNKNPLISSEIMICSLKAVAARCSAKIYSEENTCGQNPWRIPVKEFLVKLSFTKKELVLRFFSKIMTTDGKTILQNIFFLQKIYFLNTCQKFIFCFSPSVYFDFVHAPTDLFRKSSNKSRALEKPFVKRWA